MNAPATFRRRPDPLRLRAGIDALARGSLWSPDRVEREDGFDRCAQLRLHGSYDGDTEHRIAMKAIELFKSTREAGVAFAEMEAGR